MTVYETDEIIERVILVGVAFDTDDDTERSLDELGELAKTAGAQTVGRMIQTRDNFHPATYIGKGNHFSFCCSTHIIAFLRRCTDLTNHRKSILQDCKHIQHDLFI